MGWNGSDTEKVGRSVPDRRNRKNNDNRVSSRLRRSRSNASYRGLLAGLIVVIGVGLAAWLAMRPSGSDALVASDAVKPSQIQEVRPQIATNAVEAETKEEPKPDPDIIRIERKIHPGTGEYVLVTQRVVKVPANASYIGRDFPNNPIKRPKKLYDTFSENYIVGLMRTQPGFPVVGMNLPANFDEEFKARIADPVGIKEDDSEEDAAIREQMVAFKREMAQLIAEGHTPTEIVLNERKEMNRIADIRSNYIRIISDMKKEGASQEEVQDMVDAANKLLDQNGGTHIKFVTPFTINVQKEGN